MSNLHRLNSRQRIVRAGDAHQKAARAAARAAKGRRKAIRELAAAVLFSEIKRVRKLHLGRGDGPSHPNPAIAAMDARVSELMLEGLVDGSDLVIEVRRSSALHANVFPQDIWGALFRLL
ncbi:MAG TPA: hypothetical protein VEB21_20280 [Terriglobales bacterium]|nr:hypothetical protein [Terriglobales bacterium]